MQFNTRFIALSILVSAATSARAEEIPTELLTRYVNNDTLVVATARVEPELLAQLIALVEPQMTTPVDRGMMEKLKPILESWGDRRIYLIAGAADFPTPGPLAIVTASTGENVAQLTAFGDKIREHAPSNPRKNLIVDVRVVDGPALLIGTDAALSRSDSLEPQPRPELLHKLAELVENDSAVAAVFAPGPDVRRVLREMWPSLPAPGSDITGPLLADRVKQITFAAKLPPQWSANLAIHTTDDETATTIAKAGEKVVQRFAPLIQKEMPMPDIDWPAMFDLATPKQEGATVRLAVNHDNAAVAKAVAGLTGQALNDARASARRNQRMNQIRQLDLAFHNFHDAVKLFPASAAICDQDGKPLLSWRVAVLPFIDEQDLFEEFHLDEPWDSEHNKKLIAKMPEMYADPSQRDQGGKTTFLVPVHSETVFPPAKHEKVATRKYHGREVFFAEGTEFREITDGTSQTILLVEAAPESAVPWTMPADWEVDLGNPLKGLKQEGRDGFMAGFCDGHGKYIGFDVSPELLKKLLTRAGGEVIDEAY